MLRSALARLVICSSIVGMLLLAAGGPSLADLRSRDPDKARLLSIGDAPDPVTFPGQTSTLTASVGVRKVDGLGPRGSDDDDDCGEDRKGNRNHGKAFFVRVYWSIATPGAPRLVEREVAVDAPLSTQKIKTARGNKTFVIVPVDLQWDGRDAAGHEVAAATYTYRVWADFMRVHDHKTRYNRPQKVKLIDTTDTLTGAVTVERIIPPPPPSVNAVPATTNVPVVELSGEKTSNTAILVDGAVHVPLNAETTWSTTKTLLEGANRLAITARNEQGVESTPVDLSITLDTAPPPPPQVTTPPTDVTTNQVTLSGTKLAGSGVMINGVKVIAINDSTSWTYTVTLQPGANSFIVEAFDAAGNVSITQGGHVAGVVHSKPVIGNLTVTPSIAPAGQPVEIAYRLFAQVPPTDNAGLRVAVSIEDGDQLIRTVFSGVQQGGPTGLPYSVTWDGKDDAGQLVPVNTSYRVVVSAERAASTTQPRELVDANPKSTAVVITGSKTATSPDGRLKVIFRPDDAKMTIEPVSTLTARQSTVLARRGIRPLRRPYRVSVDRAFTSPVVGVLEHPQPVGRYLRPYVWDETQQDWVPISRTTWNPQTSTLAFPIPGSGLVMIGSSPDVDAPRVVEVREVPAGLSIVVADDGSGIRSDRVKVRHPRPGARRQTYVKRKGEREGAVLLHGPRLEGELRIYVEDWAGNGRLVRLRNGGGR